ncbi:MAG TPA: secondary thiamine-phosphate synthase enzyme YjbQ [Thermodesulfobacteriota bacterium]|jgi:secondary thiamine-phosphate synthase enzyme|nr:secondary thiamine-phosphate synthase enzyme YjbQ [Thermodesulfobacteriota bacterium]
MPVKTISLKLETKGETDLIDITQSVGKAVRDSGVSSGIITVFVPGSTAGVTTIEYESGAISDFRKAIERLVPKGIHYDHDARWGDGNGYSHIRAAFLGPSVTVPFSSSRLLLGTWQQIVVVDFDNRPRKREIILQIVGE